MFPQSRRTEFVAPLVAGLLLAVIAAPLGGCGSEDVSADVVLGLASYATEDGAFRFVPVTDGAVFPIEQGFQGGHHVSVAVRIVSDAFSEGDMVVTGRRTVDGVEAAVATGRLRADDATVSVDGEGRDTYAWPVLLILDESLVGVGDPFEIEAVLTMGGDAFGDSVSGTLGEPDSLGITNAIGGTRPPVEFSIEDPSPFVVERLLGHGPDCIGLADLTGGPELEVFLAGTGTISVLERVDDGWETTVSALSDRSKSPLRCSIADFDGDGVFDTAIADEDSVVVLSGGGDGSFEEVPETYIELPADAGGELAPFEIITTRGIAALDADADGRMDIYVVRSGTDPAFRFVNDGCRTDEDGGAICGHSDLDYVGHPNVVLHNVGGRFEVIENSGAEGIYQSSCVMTWDFDRDGATDVFVCNDGAVPRMYAGRGDGTFTDVTEERGLGIRCHGMGVAYGDFDGDGLDDFYVSDVGTPLLFRGRPGGEFTETDFPGLGLADQWEWGVETVDVTNDRNLDILVTAGVPELMLADAGMATGIDGPGELRLEAYPSSPLFTLHANDGTGTFGAAHATDEVLVPDGIPALVTGDIDLDGRVDAVALLEERALPMVLWGRTEDVGGWLAVDVPRGARVEVCVDEDCRHRDAFGGGSYRVARGTRVRFGLGDADEGTVRVEWPVGVWTDLGVVTSGSVVEWHP